MSHSFFEVDVIVLIYKENCIDTEPCHTKKKFVILLDIASESALFESVFFHHVMNALLLMRCYFYHIVC